MEAVLEIHIDRTAAATAKAIAAPADLHFGTFFVNSDNRYGYRDLERGRKLLGYVPEDRAEDHRQEN